MRENRRISSEIGRDVLSISLSFKSRIMRGVWRDGSGKVGETQTSRSHDKAILLLNHILIIGNAKKSIQLHFLGNSRDNKFRIRMCLKFCLIQGEKVNCIRDKINKIK
jgi:hypothetical protein